jgi:tRNA nucleotidyltransferase/poly(A) polymerase
MHHLVLGCSGSDDDPILFCIPGLKDLKAGIIRTPLPSKETFLDDPLRVMRAVRFGEFFAVHFRPVFYLASL